MQRERDWLVVNENSDFLVEAQKSNKRERKEGTKDTDREQQSKEK